MTADLAEIRRAAREQLGHGALRPGQAEAIRSVTEGRDTLAILPTGAGKSAIYQLAGLAIEGSTLVVSPLIALQQDQLESLRELGLPAAVANSAIPNAERQAAIDRFVRGELEFLLLGPEPLADPDLLDSLARSRPSLFVVDEAHCVAEWGADFRPEYRRLGAIADALGRPPILALTATASPLIRDEILARLGLRRPAVIVRGFDRPNIDLAVAIHDDPRAKRQALVDAVVGAEPPGIVYAATRNAAAEIADALAEAGVRAEAYHAGLGDRRRSAIQERFMGSDDRVIVATIAFGMGVDKPNVRFVFHHDVSESLDAYHQEIGRAGRDGEPANATLFYRPADLGLRRFHAAPPAVTEEDVRRVLRVLRRRAADAAATARESRVSRRRVEAVVARLDELDVARVEPDGTVVLVQPDADVSASVVAAEERRREVERTRVEMVRGYAETPTCRRAFLLGYFGEPFEPPCGRCDRCRAAEGGDPPRISREAVDAPFDVNDRVRHSTFGTGTVTAIEPDRITVAFEAVGYRTLAADEVTARKLLVRESG